MKKVFIDGKAGTTGLRIFNRLNERDDIIVINLSEEDRKNTGARKMALNACDIAFLCLPDDAAREAVSLIENPNVVVFDTSTAHRTAEGWTYGFPELDEKQAKKIAESKRIAVPGCHASGFIALVAPLVKAGLVDKNTAFSCFSLTGYSGGGKKMIAEYEDLERPILYEAPRQYAISQQHKHLREMRHISGIEKEPVFCPVVAPFYSGMEVTVPIHREMIKSENPISDIKALYAGTYKGTIVNFKDEAGENGFLSAGAYAGLDTMEIVVSGNDDRMILTARYDNLGKGASGAAIQCMNLVLGEKEDKGLTV